MLCAPGNANSWVAIPTWPNDGSPGFSLVCESLHSCLWESAIDTLGKTRQKDFVTSRRPLEVDKANLLRVLHLFREEE